MYELLKECFLHPRRIEAMASAFSRLQFTSFEMRAFGGIRLLIVLGSAGVATYATVISGSPVPLFLFLAITVQFFIGSLFPSRSTSFSIANPSLLLPLLAFGVIFHFGASFLWSEYQAEFGIQMAVWGAFLLVALALFQYAVATLMVHLPGKSTVDGIRWSYAVFSLVVVVIGIGLRLVNARMGSLPVFMVPMVGAIDLFLAVDKLILVGFLVLVSAEGLYVWSRSPVGLGPKFTYTPVDYPQEDVEDSFIKSIPRDARYRLIALVEWLGVQVKNIWRIVLGLIKGFGSLIMAIMSAAGRYGGTSIGAFLLLVTYLAPISLVGLAFALAHSAASSIAGRGTATFVVEFLLAMFAAAVLLLLAYLVHYYLFVTPLARHFRHSFLAFVHLCVAVAMLVGVSMWFMVGQDFQPGIAAGVVCVGYGLLGVSVFRNPHEIPRAIQGEPASAAHRENGHSESPSPTYWLFFIMLILALAIASKQWVPASVRDGTGGELSNLAKTAKGQVAAVANWMKQRYGAAAAEAALAADVAKSAANQKAAAILTAENNARDLKVALQKRGDELRKRLPECQGSAWEKWNACIGRQTYSHGEYFGEFRQGKRQGFGWYTWKDGDSYYGEFDEALNGDGVYTFDKDGTQYIGGFASNKRHGKGSKIDRQGKLLTGTIWNQGNLVGEGLP